MASDCKTGEAADVGADWPPAAAILRLGGHNRDRWGPRPSITSIMMLTVQMMIPGLLSIITHLLTGPLIAVLRKSQ